MKRYLFVFIFFLGFMPFGRTQQELGTYFQENLYQSGYFNPALGSDQKWVIALPAFYGMTHQRGLSIRSILNREIVNVFQVKNYQFKGSAETVPLGIGYRYKNFYLTFDYKLKAYTDLQVSAPLLSMALLGNASIIGGRINASPQGFFTGYSETAIGARYKKNGFSFGGRIKLLNGIQNIHTAESDFAFSVSEDIYQLQLNGEMLINSSFPINFSNLDSVSINSLNLFPNNIGIGTDLGISYKTGPIQISASVLDLGFINWKQNVRNYNIEGSFTYEGADFNDVIGGDFNFIDTLGAIFDIEETRSAYSSYVPSKIFACIVYDINDDWNIGGLGYFLQKNEVPLGAIALNASRNWRNRHRISIQYAIIGTNFGNFGISGFTTLGPFQFYASLDNALGFIQPLGAQNVNGRLGLNLVFGKKGDAGYARL